MPFQTESQVSQKVLSAGLEHPTRTQNDFENKSISQLDYAFSYLVATCAYTVIFDFLNSKIDTSGYDTRARHHPHASRPTTGPRASTSTLEKRF